MIMLIMPNNATTKYGVEKGNVADMRDGEEWPWPPP